MVEQKETLDEQKEVLIDLVIWYRDEYHKQDDIHSRLIQQIREAADSEELERYEKVVDEWLG